MYPAAGSVDGTDPQDSTTSLTAGPTDAPPGFRSAPMRPPIGGALLTAVAALLVLAVVRGQSSVALVMAGRTDWPTWLLVAVLAVGGLAALLVWARWPGRGWLPAVIGAVLAAPVAVLGVAGALPNPWSGSGYVLIGMAVQLAPPFLFIGVLAIARNLLLSERTNVAAAVATGAVLVQLLPVGLVPSIVPGSEVGVPAAPEFSTGVSDTVSTRATTATVVTVLLVAVIVLVGVGAAAQQRAARVEQARNPVDEHPVHRTLVVVGVAATLLQYIAVYWTAVFMPDGGLDGLKAVMIACGALLLVLGPVLAGIGGPALVRGVLPAALAFIVLEILSSGALYLVLEYRGQLALALAVGIAIGITLAVQRIAAALAVALILLLAVVLLIVTLNARAFDGSESTVMTMTLGAVVVAAAAVGAITGAATRVFAGGRDADEYDGMPTDRPARKVRPAGDELVVGLAVLLPVIATGGTQLLAGAQLAARWPDEVWMWVLVGMTVLAAATLATWLPRHRRHLSEPASPDGEHG